MRNLANESYFIKFKMIYFFICILNTLSNIKDLLDKEVLFIKYILINIFIILT